ncbi:sulfotransferase family protein [Vibrio mexicanus]|uniref:sulfotransferase family protein n=1 Tax=Vibrio mexicanus TaxID=1004326 RepID=UPI00063CC62D|nr:sulfotransferase family protein [Vibrio mexicanus]
MNIAIKQMKTLTVFRATYLEKVVQNNNYNLISGGTPRGGTSILGLLMKYFEFEMGKVHPTVYEDLDFHGVEVANWPELVKRKCKEMPGWSVKMPIATSCLSAFEQSCPMPVFLIIIRNPFSVSKSLIKHDPEYSSDEASYIKGMREALVNYNNFISELSSLSSPYIIVEHEKIMNSPKCFVSELVEVLNIKVDDEKIAQAVSLISRPGYKSIN